MSHIQIKNVDDEVHAAIRQRAAEEGRTISDYVLELIRRDLRSQRRRDWIERALDRPVFHLDENVAEAIRRDRDEREPW